uniref:Si:ch211-266g18.9 n=1 Tax=Sinocyclocheilus grahami TaxID=75366 RepID=A0A672Q5D7_SINGR
MDVFTPVLVFQKMPSGKGKDKFSIQCLECFGKNLYIGTKEGVVEYLTVNNMSSEESLSVRDVGKRQMGRSGAISQLTAVPVLNHLLVLWDCSVTVLNMFSLKLIPALKKIHVALPQEPMVLAVHGTCLCVAICDRYFLHDYQSQTTLYLFPHNLGKQNIIANKCMFVMKNGTSHHPPVQWPDGVVDAAVQFPYVLALQNQTVHIYSILDQQLKQTVPLQSAKSLVSTEGSFYHLTSIFINRSSEVIRLVKRQRVDEALMLLDRLQDLLPKDSYKDLHKNVICTSGMIKFYREAFVDAKELFIKGELDPREIISLHPAMPVMSEDFAPQTTAVSNAKDLWTLRFSHLDCSIKVKDPSHISIFQHIVNTLSNLEHKPLIWKFVDWVLQSGLQRQPCYICKEEVLNILTNYSVAMTVYLEYLVNELHSKVTYLFIINDCFKGMKHKLQQLLWQSSFYNADATYEQIPPSFLHVEKAVLLGKSGKHKKALQVLVHEEKDQHAAESYCWWTSAGRDRKFTEGMFLNLTQIYLSHPVIAAVNLLNKTAASFDLVSVLRVLPDSWSLKLVLRFLCESLERNGARQKNERSGDEPSQAMLMMYLPFMPETSYRTFLRRPTGELTHISCHGGESGH